MTRTIKMIAVLCVTALLSTMTFIALVSCTKKETATNSTTTDSTRTTAPSAAPSDPKDAARGIVSALEAKDSVSRDSAAKLVDEALAGMTANGQVGPSSETGMTRDRAVSELVDALEAARAEAPASKAMEAALARAEYVEAMTLPFRDAVSADESVEVERGRFIAAAILTKEEGLALVDKALDSAAPAFAREVLESMNERGMVAAAEYAEAKARIDKVAELKRQSSEAERRSSGPAGSSATVDTASATAKKPAAAIPTRAAKPTAARPQLKSEFVLVKGGAFQMGQRGIAEPVHAVTLGDYRLSKYEVTQGEWQSVMGSNPSAIQGYKNLPVESVSWLDAVAFCNAKSLKDGLAPAYRVDGASVTCDFGADGYRLPTEAEWEYAARGGQKSRGTRYAGSDDIDAVAFYKGNSGDLAHEVALKAANELGLYDMSGNVWEWCWDNFGSYDAADQTDPVGPGGDDYRVLRGGSWYYNEDGARTSIRYPYDPSYRDEFIGLRLAQSVR